MKTLINLYKMVFGRKPLSGIHKRNASSGIIGAGTSTGIEHALKFNDLGKSHKNDVKNYKCAEYLNQNTYSYYNKECELQSFRAPQPTNRAPDVEPRTQK